MSIRPPFTARIGRALVAAVLVAAVLFAAGSSGAGAGDAPVGRGYVVMMTQPQIASGLARHLVPPLTDALDRSGMINAKGPTAEWVVSVDSAADDGAWLGSGESRRWRHERTVSVVFAPNRGFPRSPDVPTLTVAAKVVTADPDRTDELRCLVDLAVKTAFARWSPSGRLAVHGVACEHGER